VDKTKRSQLVEAFADTFIDGKRFENIISARNFAESILNQKVVPGTVAAKDVDEAVEQGLVRAARNLVLLRDPIQSWEQCLDLYNSQPGLNTRTSTSILQQAYSTPIPIAYLASQLAGISRETTVYEPAAGNGALLLTADPGKATVNELNPDRAAGLRSQGFTVTEQDASSFLPQIEPVDCIITNPPFGSLKDAQGQTMMFQQGLLTTSQLDHAIALLALDLLKPKSKAVLILGGKMGDNQSRAERYNTQLTRGFYHWLYKGAGYKVNDHFSIAGNLYRKQGTSFPIDIILLEGKGSGETQIKLPAVRSPRIYESYETLKEVLVNVIQQQQSVEPSRPLGITLQQLYTRPTLDANLAAEYGRTSLSALDNSNSPSTNDSDRESRGILFSTNAASGVADRGSDQGLVKDVRAAGGEGSRELGSQGDQPDFANVHEQLVTAANTPADGSIFRDEPPRTTVSMFPRGGSVSSHSSSYLGVKSEKPGRHEPDRVVGLDERGGKSPISGLNTMSDKESDAQDQELALGNQILYKPRSRALSLNTLIPSAALKGLESAFNKIEATTGMKIDEYVCSRLKEPSQELLFKHYAAEQIDSLALAIYNHEYDRKATLIGHDTGIGKTRIVCGLARYAQAHGLIPAIVTVDPVLYGDILARDAVDTGNHFNPLITNNDFKVTLTLSTGEEIGEITTPKTQSEKIKECVRSGTIGGHDSIFSTYGQLTGPASLDRRQLLSSLAPQMFLILDESHKAGGAAGVQRPDPGRSISCTEFFQSLVTQTSGFVASSATAIKDPIVAARLFYETTDIKLAAPDRETFTEHLKAGGVPLQQQVFTMWAESGGVMRCEKSYEGVEFGIQKVPVSLQTAENNAQILNLIWQFDQLKRRIVSQINEDLREVGEVAREKNSALGEAGATSTIFTSVLHNLSAVTSLGLKAEETANAVIQDIEQGRKPIVMLFNTMESTIKNFIETHNELAISHNVEFPDSPMKRIEFGDAISINAGELFTRYLEKSRVIKITEPYLDPLTYKQKTRVHRLTDDELGSAGVFAYNRAASAIAKAEWSQLPISPIDYLKQKVEDAGHTIGEITGRTHVLKYESADDIKTGVVTYSTREHGTAQKKQVMDGFQNGKLDAIITNSTTGYSLHAARTVADQRQRVMYIVQPYLDINQVEQSIGRSHRSGQVNPDLHTLDRLDEQGRPMWGQYPGTFGLPIFKLVVGQDLPTEERTVAILMKKMSHLKANTTGNSSSSFGLKDMPDFLNDYGNEVAVRLMEENPKLHADLDRPLGHGDELDHDKAIQKVTGRAVMLTSNEAPTPEKPYPALARQAELYDTLTSEYKEYLAQKIALGENELEAQKLDLQAEPSQRLVLNAGNPEIDSPFADPTYLVEVRAKTGAKPNTTLQVANAVRKELGFELLSDLTDHDDYERSDVRERGREVAQETVEELRSATDDFLTVHTQTKEAELTVVRGRAGKYEEKLNAQVAIQAELEQQLVRADTGIDIPLVTKLKAQLQQQQPKLDKLQQQLNKVKLDLNAKEFQFNKEQRLVKATLQDVSALLKRFSVGQGVRLVDRTTHNSLYGIVVGVEQLNRANNPAAPANWKLKLLVVDGVRSLSIKLDNLIAKAGKQSLEPIETAPSFVNPKQESSIYGLFDERQTEAKEKRYLVSGQVLAAKLTGKFAQVTDNQGQVHPVYLLRRGFDPEKDLDKKPIKFEKPEQINQFLFEVTQKQGVIQADDENLTIVADIRRSNEGGIVLKTPKATSQGGIYFKDEGLLELTGDFVSKTESVHQDGTTKSQSIMAVPVPREKVEEVLSYVSQKWNVGAASHKNAAREMLGQTLAEWEPCSAINPALKREVVFKTPVRTTTLVQNNLQLAPDASTAQKELTNSFPLTIKSNDSPDLTRLSQFRETSSSARETSTDSLPVQKSAELTSSLAGLEMIEAPSLSSQNETVEVELKPTTEFYPAQQSAKLDSFLQGQMSLADALKLPVSSEQAQTALTSTQPHLTQPTRHRTSRRPKQTQSETQQLSLFATTEYNSCSNKTLPSSTSKRVEEKAHSLALNPQGKRTLSIKLTDSQ